MRRFRKNKTGKVDKQLLIWFVVMSLVGLVAVADASAPVALRNFSDQFYFVKQQAGWAILGILAMLVMSRIDYSMWEKYASVLFFISLFGLVLVFIPGFGSKLLGAKRWFVIGSFVFQPSEIVKLTLAMYLAKVASKKMEILSYIVPMCVVALLVMLQPDLGTTIVLMTIGLVQLFVSGVNLISFFAVLSIGGLGGLLLTLTSEYRRDRLLTFLQQTKDPLGKAYHIRQILFALGAGGLFGVGLGQSRQKYLYLPETASDSIYAVIAEETGFVGASAVIVLFAFFIYKSLKIAEKAPDTFSRTLTIGLTTWIGGQAFLNIASMVAIVPLTGIPLPFLSYGGSSLVSILAASGIILNISKHATSN